MALKRTGGKHASAFDHFCSRHRMPIHIVHSAAIREALPPTIASTRPNGPMRLDINTPTTIPGTANGKKNGNIVNASEILNCTASYANGYDAIVSAIYNAAINPAKTIFLILILFNLYTIPLFVLAAAVVLSV